MTTITTITNPRHQQSRRPVAVEIRKKMTTLPDANEVKIEKWSLITEKWAVDVDEFNRYLDIVDAVVVDDFDGIVV